MREEWHEVMNAPEVPSPCLLIYPDRVQENIRRMIRIGGRVERMRPHIKTHKLVEVLKMQMEQGITRFKCATVAEAEMAAACGAPDVLLAYQPVGPNALRLLELGRRFPESRFSAVVDDAGVVQNLSRTFTAANRVLDRSEEGRVGK